jgi:GNAT superfamily N-acetyltransferase
MEILQATIADAKEILALQRLAYQSEAALYNDYNIPPLKQTLTEIEADFQKSTFLKAIFDGAIIGSVRAYQDQGKCFIGRLIVDSLWQGKGIGTELMRRIEAIFTSVQSFELFTGYKSERNIRLYEHLGYSVVRNEGILVFMEKTNIRAT